MSCPNSDANFDKMLSNFIDTTKDYPKKRKLIFYFICIVVRLLLYSFIYYNINNTYIVILATILSLFSIINLYKNLNMNQQWWSKKFQFIISSLVFIVGIASLIFIYYEKNVKILNIPFVKFIPILLFISLFGGIFQSLLIDFC